MAKFRPVLPLPIQGEYCGVGLLPSALSEDLAKFRITVEFVFCLVGARRLEGEVGDPHTWTLWRTALRAGSGSALAAGSIPVRPFFLFSL